MELAPVAGIRTVSLFSPRRVEAEAPLIVIDEPARADDEERSAQHEGQERGLDEGLEWEPGDEEAEQRQKSGEWIDVTA